jgi:hypothetical protein
LRVQDILQQQSTLEINDLFSHSINPDADDEGVREFECLACTWRFTGLKLDLSDESHLRLATGRLWDAWLLGR